MNTSPFSNTPTLTVLDHRGLTVRDIAYHRHPDSPFVTNVRITRHHHDAGGFLSRSADPRLHVSGRVNFSHITGLNGSVLRAQGADNGTTVSLNDAAGRPLISVSNIRTIAGGADDRSQAVTSSLQYEDATLPGRPHSITERLSGEAARITERFVYAGSAAEEKAMNRAGACVSHYDTAGLVQTDCIALTGTPLSVTRHLLKEADNSDVVADWQGTGVPSWDALLDGDDEGYTTLTTADASGAMLTTTDSKDNLQRVAYDVAGRLWGSWLTLKNGTEQVIVASLTWSAAGQKLREVHGNGVVTTYTYDARTQRLTGMKTERPAGHPAGARVLQDLRYEYDPVGNVLKSTNDAEETRFWRNQKAVPENTYVYDSLYQLVSATGRETGSASQQDSNLPAATVPLPGDSSAFTNYTRTYTYDSAGNLTQVRHGAPATNNSYTTDITVSDKSNRGVLSTLTENPAEVDALFTAGGQQKQLQPGQSLVWTPRNELLKVTPVMRDGDVSDRESYRYDGGSQRILKISKQKTGSSTQTQRVVYLPGLELRTTTAGDTETEVLQVITVGEAGRAQVRVLHWLAGNPAEITGDQIRYSYDNLTGSSQLELDGEGQVISMEEYYPYGGTAVWTARSVMEAEYKTVRYSGKERDATGLYYYGYRYYQPWAGRWLSADPAGTVDGLNLFRMCLNNPLRYADDNGLMFNSRAIGNLLDSSNRNDNSIVEYYNNIVIPKSISILDDAAFYLDNIDTEDNGVKKIFNGLFMVEPDDFSENLQEKYETIRGALVERGENFISIKDDVFMGLHSTAGAVAAADTLGGGKIHVNRDFMNRVKFEKKESPASRAGLKPVNIDEYGDLYFSAIIIHEASHLALDTKDHSYVKSAQYIELEGIGLPVNMENLYNLARADDGISKSKENADSIAYSAILLNMQEKEILSYYPHPDSDLVKATAVPKRARMEITPEKLKSIFAFRLKNF